MVKRRRSFTRESGFKDKNKKLVLAVEGHATENAYFNLFKVSGVHIDVQVLSRKTKGHPTQVYSKLKDYIAMNKIQLKKGDEVWVVVDRDAGNRTEQQLNEVYENCCKERFQLALSNPCFEYWLILHFENPAAKDVGNAHNCKQRLKKYLPNFEKNHVEVNKLKPHIRKAIAHAKQVDSPPCSDWPHTTGSTVYRLVEKLLP